MQDIQRREDLNQLALTVARQFVAGHMLLVIDNLETPEHLTQDIMLRAIITELNECQNTRSRLLITTCDDQMCRTLESIGCDVHDFSLTTQDNEQHVMRELLDMLSRHRFVGSALEPAPGGKLAVRSLDSVLVPCKCSCFCTALGSGASYGCTSSVNLKTTSGRACIHVLYIMEKNVLKYPSEFTVNPGLQHDGQKCLLRLYHRNPMHTQQGIRSERSSCFVLYRRR